MSKYQAYPEYKDSGVEWLGDIPEHWVCKKLKWEVSAKSGTDDKHEEGLFDLYGANGVIGKTNTISILNDSGVVIVGRVGSAGAVTYVQKKSGISDNALIINNYSFDLPRFDYYLFLTVGLDELVSKNAQPLITASNIKDIRVCVPRSFEERLNIANFLDHETAKIDTLIDKQQQLIQLLKEKRQAVISQAVTKGLNPNAPMRDSGVEWLGEVPEHWDTSKLKYLATQIVDGAHFTPTYVDEGVPFLRVTDIHNVRIDKENIKYIPSNEHQELIKRCNPQKGDLLLSKNGTIGIPKVVDWDWEFSVFVSLCLIKFSKKLCVNYAYYFFKTHEIDEQIYGQIKQSTVINLHLDKIREFDFTVPPLGEQREIVKSLDQTIGKYDLQVAKAEEMNTLLQERRTALISAAVTGKIDVRHHVSRPSGNDPIGA